MKPTIRILLVEDNAHDAQHLRHMLSLSTQARFEITRDGWLRSALTKLAGDVFHMVLLDLSLPDAHGLDAMIALSHEAPSTPVLVVTGADNVATAITATKLGASDYVVKGDLTPTSLERTILLAIERKRGELVDARLAAISDEQVEGSSQLQYQTDAIARAILDIDRRLRDIPEAHAAFTASLDAHGLLPILHRINVRRSLVGRATDTRIDDLSRIVTSYTKESYPTMPAVSVSEANETFMRSIQALTGDILPHGA